ncbi:RNA polymerase sigma-70 factor, ECF subfamily [Ruminococcaceae bacterium YRB3002]|nr:RNA polymerase sigma-70 factor, ECF subfamily [Ruminococcaceae bacterium YRB3002]
MEVMFDNVFCSFSETVYRTAYLRTRNHYDSEDIVQDVFIKLWMVSDHEVFASEEHLKHWLLKVTVNCCNEHWRKTLRHPTVSLEEIEEPVVLPEDNIIVSEIDGMSYCEEQVLRLYCFEGLSYKELSSMLDISEAAARQRLSRARRALSERLGA